MVDFITKTLEFHYYFCPFICRKKQHGFILYSNAISCEFLLLSTSLNLNHIPQKDPESSLLSLYSLKGSILHVNLQY